IFSFDAMNPETYTVVIEKEGFAAYRAENVKVSPGTDRPLNGITLQAGVQAVEVNAADELQGIQTASAEVAATIINEQIERLPQLSRDPVTLAQTQPGVTNNGATFTVINGLRN